jgi:selenocysteine-specific elongation factor
MAASVLDAAQHQMAALLEEFHRANPLSSGLSLQELRGRLRLPQEFADHLLKQAAEAGLIETDGAEVRRFGWAPKLSARQSQALGAIVARLAGAGWEPPSLADLQAEFGDEAGGLLRIAQGNGDVVQIDVNRYYTAGHLNEIIARINAAVSPGQEVAPTEVRELLGLSRKYVIPLLEYFDRVGLAQRRGEARVWTGRGGRA